ncbi:MAG: phosphoglycerate kinase [Ignavibacteria bacterium]|nr:phosphoglycerate kinase [Ignavibacteria bacterium]
MSSNKLTLQDLIDKNEIKNKRILVRVDFNVPIDENGIITDDNRILQSLPTIKAIIKNGGKCILMSHLGRPKGEKNPKYSLSAVAEYLSNVLNFPVLFSDDCISENNTEVINEMQGGDVLLLENLRFYKEEEKNDPGFAEKLASYGDIYVNDAFGTAHRAHASTEGVTHFIKTCAAGYLMEKELKYLSEAIINPARPLCAILGGSKISGKIDVLENLLGSADTILIGGGMMFTFYKAMGYNIGKSILEEDKVGLAKEILEKAKTSNTKLLLPADVLMAEKFEQGSKTVTVKADGITSEYNDWMGVDIGPETIKLYSDEISKSKTIVWNGPMGVFEIDDFADGTMQIANALADATAKGAVTIIGGGDSASAVAKAGLEKKISHVSTGGGASLEFLEGKKLPGVEALSDN